MAGKIFGQQVLVVGAVSHSLAAGSLGKPLLPVHLLVETSSETRLDRFTDTFPRSFAVPTHQQVNVRSVSADAMAARRQASASLDNSSDLHCLNPVVEHYDSLFKIPSITGRHVGVGHLDPFFTPHVAATTVRKPTSMSVISEEETRHGEPPFRIPASRRIAGIEQVYVCTYTLYIKSPDCCKKVFEKL